jgi:hypothetical protein
MHHPKAEIWRYWPLVLLLSALVGCAFQYATSWSIGPKSKREAEMVKCHQEPKVCTKCHAGQAR